MRCATAGRIALSLAWMPNLPAQDQPVPAAIDTDGVQRVTIVGGSYFFRPDRILAKAGRPLHLIVSMEEGIVPHRFVLDGPVGKPVADIELATKPKTVQIELPPGQYAFSCPNRLLMFKSHRERGMSGTLEIRN
ncbi:cupredoxin domain-containing protein [Aromatoleum toluclasticum]|uniref:cupredoxin domain-containing protein n=1 Tax=Aromatoleum toluclasticum TaxID=92003 RepID=UPI001D188F84|nr:cupredoxin domain-containing protein [Aromatoleum toluclasticum]MCC4118523.1 cupredoxin domain-containing protein [Aromatoleum toluclasticum]